MPDSSSPHPSRPKIGLALGSGMARGWAHIGVIRALREMGFEFDIIAGCSIGALVGGVYLAGKMDRLEEWASDLTKRRIVGYLDLGVRNGGMIGGKRLPNEIRNHLGEQKIEELPKPYIAVATDLLTGHEIWLQKGNLTDAMRASFSVPGVLPPMKHEGRWLVDGALINPVPVSVCRALGADMVIAVNINADNLGKTPHHDIDAPGASEDLMSMTEHEAERAPTGLMGRATKMAFRKTEFHPSLFGTMTSALNIMQDRITRSRLAGDPPDVHIAPRVGHIGLLDFDRCQDAIKEGHDAVKRKRHELADALYVMHRSGRD